ncbi:MFS transporter [Bacillus sp. CH30_1T]|uniref:MFS transporter n=1 Tax=Bacillus sp. CH30_1T TaxID=2604836 RepID=UPI0011EE4B05|nr:MFS transporter [Bacillus sp. CH30_1T]KAA0560873.1 MFS transporter [Bacillus sp. CH30_1T]
MFKNRSFNYLWIGQSIADIADVFYIIATISILYNLSQSATLTAMVPLVITSAMFISGVISPLLIDKYIINKLLFVTQLMKTGLLLVLWCFSYYISFDSIFLLLVIVFLIGLLDGCANPLKNSLVPILVSEEQLVKANSLVSALYQTIKLGSWPIGSILLVLIGYKLVILTVCVLYLFSSILIGLIENVKKVEQPLTTSKGTQLKEGWILIWNNKRLRTLISMDIMETIASVVWIAAILYIYVEEALGVDKEWWGYINGSFFLGLFVGSLFSLKKDKLLERYSYNFILLGTSLSAVLTLFFGNISIPILALILSGMIGLFSQPKDVSQQTILQKSTTTDLLPKVFSAQMTLVTSIFGVTSLVFGIIVDKFGIHWVFNISGVLLLLVTLLVIKSRDTLVLSKIKQLHL